MSEYKDTIITNKGLVLAEKAAHGLANFEIKKATGSEVDLSNYTDSQIQDLTSLKDGNIAGSLVDNGASDNDTLAETIVSFDNQNLTKGYYLRTIALWATDLKTKEEVLYSITRAITPEYIPDFNRKNLLEFKINIQIIVGNRANVTIVLNNSSYATIGYVSKLVKEYDSKLNKLQENVTKDLMPKLDTKVTDNKNDTITVNDKVMTPVDKTSLDKKADITYAKYPVQNLVPSSNVDNLSNGFYAINGINIGDNAFKGIGDNTWAILQNYDSITGQFAFGLNGDGKFLVKAPWTKDRQGNSGSWNELASKYYANYPLDELNDDDDLYTVHNGYYNSQGKKLKNGPFQSDTAFWGTIFKSNHYMRAEDSDGYIYTNRHGGNVWGVWKRVLNIVDNNSLVSQIKDVKEFAKYPQQTLKNGDVIINLSDGYYTSWGIKNLDLPNYYDNAFWGTVFKTIHYVKATRNDGNVYIKNNYAGKWGSWIRLLNEEDSKKLKSDLDTKLAQQKEVILDLNRPKLSSNPESDSKSNPDQWFYEEI